MRGTCEQKASLRSRKISPLTPVSSLLPRQFLLCYFLFFTSCLSQRYVTPISQRCSSLRSVLPSGLDRVFPWLLQPCRRESSSPSSAVLVNGPKQSESSTLCFRSHVQSKTSGSLSLSISISSFFYSDGECCELRFVLTSIFVFCFLRFSNRAFCYSQLELHKHVIKDCDKALELDPALLQAYILKGVFFFFLFQSFSFLRFCM